MNVHAKQKVDGREVKDERAVAVLSNAVVRLQGSVLRERDTRNTGPGSSCARRLMGSNRGMDGKVGSRKARAMFRPMAPSEIAPGVVLDPAVPLGRQVIRILP